MHSLWPFSLNYFHKRTKKNCLCHQFREEIWDGWSMMPQTKHTHTQMMLHKSKQGKDYVIYGRFKAISLWIISLNIDLDVCAINNIPFACLICEYLCASTNNYIIIIMCRMKAYTRFFYAQNLPFRRQNVNHGCIIGRR